MTSNKIITNYKNLDPGNGNHELIVSPLITNRKKDSLFGYNNIIESASEFTQKHLHVLKKDDLMVSLGFGIGNFTTKTVSKEVPKIGLRNRLQSKTPGPTFLQNYVLIFYVQITSIDKSASTFSAAIPLKYDLIQNILKSEDYDFNEIISNDTYDLIINQCVDIVFKEFNS